MFCTVTKYSKEYSKAEYEVTQYYKNVPKIPFKDF